MSNTYFYENFFKDLLKERNNSGEIVRGNLISGCISAFDHWLNEEEAEENIILYSNILDAKASLQLKDQIRQALKYYSFEAKFLCFYQALYLKYNVYKYNSEEERFKPFSSMKKFLREVQASIREEKFIEVYIKDLECLILGNYDMTLPFFCANEEGKAKLQSLAKMCGLFILKQ